MTCSIRILTTFTVDSSPALLLVSPNGDTTLVNCGEGCQRSFLETSGLRTRSVTRVCLTHIGHDAIGGLPGMVLTTADVAIAAAASVAALQGESTTPAKRKAPDEEENDMVGLDVVGPEGTQAFLHSLRHFMRRDKFQLRVKEGLYRQMPGESLTRNKATKRSRKKGKNTDIDQGFYVQTIPLVHRWSRKSASGSMIETQVLSFIFTTPPIPGKFLPDKARELGIPPGPLYAKLKNGQSVTFVDGDGVEQTVESHQVVAKGSAGVAVAVVYCPSECVLDQLKESQTWETLKEQGPDSPVLDVMVHMTSSTLFASQAYRSWIQAFPSDVEHVWLESAEYLSELGHRISTAHQAMSPFRAAATGALTRSLLNPEVFPSPVALSSSGAGAVSSGDDEGMLSSNEFGLKLIQARPGLEYKLIPRSKRGFCTPSTEGVEEERKEASSVAAETGALELARAIMVSTSEKAEAVKRMEKAGELIFTGTGSAIPCKHRNVTGMYLKMENDSAMLLDAGEGTIGQLLRVMQSGTDFQHLLRGIKAVWISHPHADHHLGLLRFLSERNTLSGYGTDPVVLMAPPTMFAFLQEYSVLDASMAGSYLPLDCRDLGPRTKNPLGDKLFQDLGITRVVSVPVAHCPYSYAVVIDGTPFGRVAYSGDCRPSMDFAVAATNTDLLIHESTFEDGMEEEAVLKRHCTVGEALRVGEQMQAKSVVLTHFSQRYPRIPPLREVTDESSVGSNQPRIVFAFDFMKLTPGTVAVASKLTPALRLLYPCDQEADQNEETGEVSVATSSILSIPGLFAQKELL